jgi:hypothetical protein
LRIRDDAFLLLAVQETNVFTPLRTFRRLGILFAEPHEAGFLTQNTKEEEFFLR